MAIIPLVKQSDLYIVLHYHTLCHEIWKGTYPFDHTGKDSNLVRPSRETCMMLVCMHFVEAAAYQIKICGLHLDNSPPAICMLRVCSSQMCY